MPFMAVETSASYASIADVPDDSGNVLFMRDEARIKRNREAFDAVYRFACDLYVALNYDETWRDVSDVCDDPDSPEGQRWQETLRNHIAAELDGALGCLCAIEGTIGAEHYWSVMIADDLEQEYGPHD